MNKEELVHITLKQLSESLKITPENFRFEDSSLGHSSGNFTGPTIIWQFKVQLEDKFIPDPLNSTKTIIVMYSKMSKQLSCHIYNREVNNLNHAIMPDTQVIIQYHDQAPAYLYRTYRQFISLKKSLIQKKNDKDFIDYMKKLTQIFPTAHDDDLFK